MTGKKSAARRPNGGRKQPPKPPQSGASSTAPPPDPGAVPAPAASASTPPAPAAAPVPSPGATPPVPDPGVASAPAPGPTQPHKRRFLHTLRAKVIASASALVLAAAGAIAVKLVNAGTIAGHDLLFSHTSAQPTATHAALPFTVAVSVDYSDCNAFALPGALASGPDYADLVSNGSFTDQQWADFLDSLSGSPIGDVDIALTFSGVQGTTTRITNVEVKRVHTGNADSGTYIPIPHQGGGDDSYDFGVKLDDPNAKLQGLAGQRDFPGFEINVSPTVSSTVDVVFSGTKHDYTWVFQVDYDVNGMVKTYEVTMPDGKPFSLTGESSNYAAVYAYVGSGYELTNQHTVSP